VQRVITPDCPRCHGALWFTPCPRAGQCADQHFYCEHCRAEWTYRESDDAWYRFDHAGQVRERIPPRPKLFRKNQSVGE
jgi:hypothetical protein